LLCCVGCEAADEDLALRCDAAGLWHRTEVRTLTLTAFLPTLATSTAITSFCFHITCLLGAVVLRVFFLRPACSLYAV
jgi:hypothetical protein